MSLITFKKIKICVGYLLNGKHINYLPSSAEDQKNLKPIYEVIEGWKGSVAGIKNIDQLPKQAKFYIKRVEELIGCKIILISTSPERLDTIHLENPFEENKF